MIRPELPCVCQRRIVLGIGHVEAFWGVFNERTFSGQDLQDAVDDTGEEHLEPNMFPKCRDLGFGTDNTYVPYDPSNPDANGNGPPYSDGKPMAAVFQVVQTIDDGSPIPVATGTPPGPDEPGTCPQSPKNPSG